MRWLWHALFDGTRLCRCAHSRRYRAHLRAVDEAQRRQIADALRRFEQTREGR